VLHVREQFAVSERKACRAVGQSRTTQRRPARPVITAELELRRWLREYAKKNPRHGYRTACSALRLEGRIVNKKRVQRLWREEGLRVPPQQPKRSRVGQSVVPGDRLRAVRPNQVWALDFQFDTTSDGRPIKAFAMCDEFTRENIGRDLKRSIKAEDVVKVLEQAKAKRGAPEYIRMDNGPELIAQAIRDWCQASGTGTVYIEPGSPWENPFIESFNSRARDELFSREIFHSVLEGRVMYFDWCDRYNTKRPHSSLGGLPPSMFASLIGKGPTVTELPTR
jgi:putative transposase